MLLRYWMLSHAYMGVIAGVLLLMHAGTRGGGILTTSLMITFDLVILTGLWGIATYYVVPRMLTKIEEQPLLVDDLILRRKELTEEIADTVARASQATRDAIEKGVIPHFLTFGYLLSQLLAPKRLAVATAEARKHFEQTALTLPPNERDSFFGTVERTATLRRVDALILLHKSLKAWLVPHVLTTSLMLALMVVHIIQVIYFAVK
ncbi:MAG: hypothetical protein U0Q11_25535 [Vicinamibacterales bacterium]